MSSRELTRHGRGFGRLVIGACLVLSCAIWGGTVNAEKSDTDSTFSADKGFGPRSEVKDNPLASKLKTVLKEQGSEAALSVANESHAVTSFGTCQPHQDITVLQQKVENEDSVLSQCSSAIMLREYGKVPGLSSHVTKYCPGDECGSLERMKIWNERCGENATANEQASTNPPSTDNSTAKKKKTNSVQSALALLGGGNKEPESVNCDDISRVAEELRACADIDVDRYVRQQGCIFKVAEQFSKQLNTPLKEHIQNDCPGEHCGQAKRVRRYAKSCADEGKKTSFCDNVRKVTLALKACENTPSAGSETGIYQTPLMLGDALLMIPNYCDELSDDHKYCDTGCSLRATAARSKLHLLGETLPAYYPRYNDNERTRKMCPPFASDVESIIAPVTAKTRISGRSGGSTRGGFIRSSSSSGSSGGSVVRGSSSSSRGSSGRGRGMRRSSRSSGSSSSSSKVNKPDPLPKYTPAAERKYPSGTDLNEWDYSTPSPINYAHALCQHLGYESALSISTTPITTNSKDGGFERDLAPVSCGAGGVSKRLSTVYGISKGAVYQDTPAGVETSLSSRPYLQLLKSAMTWNHYEKPTRRELQALERNVYSKYCERDGHLWYCPKGETYTLNIPDDPVQALVLNQVCKKTSSGRLACPPIKTSKAKDIWAPKRKNYDLVVGLECTNGNPESHATIQQALQQNAKEKQAEANAKMATEFAPRYEKALKGYSATKDERYLESLTDYLRFAPTGTQADQARLVLFEKRFNAHINADGRCVTKTSREACAAGEGPLCAKARDAERATLKTCKEQLKTASASCDESQAHLSPEAELSRRCVALRQDRTRVTNREAYLEYAIPMYEDCSPWRAYDSTDPRDLKLSRVMNEEFQNYRASSKKNVRVKDPSHLSGLVEIMRADGPRFARALASRAALDGTIDASDYLVVQDQQMRDRLARCKTAATPDWTQKAEALAKGDDSKAELASFTSKRPETVTGFETSLKAMMPKVKKAIKKYTTNEMKTLTKDISRQKRAASKGDRTQIGSDTEPARYAKDQCEDLRALEPKVCDKAQPLFDNSTCSVIKGCEAKLKGPIKAVVAAVKAEEKRQARAQACADKKCPSLSYCSQGAEFDAYGRLRSYPKRCGYMVSSCRQRDSTAAMKCMQKRYESCRRGCGIRD